MANVILPRIGTTEPKNEEVNPLKHLKHLFKRHGANAPPAASKLTRERFSIFVATDPERSLPDLAVSGVAHQGSIEEVKVIDIGRNSSIHAFNYECQPRGSFIREGSNPLLSISLLKIKGVAKVPVKTVKELFTQKPKSYHANTIDPEDVSWDDFNNSEKLKDNLDMLLQCKKMNINFEVARANNLPGLLVVPKFHCTRCYEAWLKDEEAPHDCDQPEDPVRGAPIALDERANVFLKDHKVSFIDIRPKNQSIDKSINSRRPTFDYLKHRKSPVQNIRHNNSFIEGEGVGEETTEEGESAEFETRMAVHYKFKKPAHSQASGIDINDNKKIHKGNGNIVSEETPVSKDKKNPENSDVTYVDSTLAALAMSSEAEESDGIRKYGGMTNSEARVFINRSLIDAEAKRSAELVSKQIERNTDSNTKLNKQKASSSSSKENISNKHRKRNKGKYKTKDSPQNNDKYIAINHEGTLTTSNGHTDNKDGLDVAKDIKDDNNSSDVTEEMNTVINQDIGRNKDVTTTPQQKEVRRMSIAQSITLEINPEDTANDIFTKAKKRKPPPLKAKKQINNSRRPSDLTTVPMGEANKATRRASIQVRADEQYLMQGGNIMSRQNMNERLVGDSNNGSMQSSGTVKPDNGELIRDEGDSRTQVRRRRKDHQSGRNEISDYHLPPVDLLKSGKRMLSSAESRSSREGSLSNIEGSRPTSKSHLNCRDSSSGEIFNSSKYSGVDFTLRGNLRSNGQNIGTGFVNSVKKHNIFASLHSSKDGKRVSINGGPVQHTISREQLTPSPVTKQSFPKSDLMALKMTNLTQPFTFSFYQLPGQYKKYNEHVQSKVNGIGKSKSSKNKSKKK